MIEAFANIHNLPLKRLNELSTRQTSTTRIALSCFLISSIITILLCSLYGNNNYDNIVINKAFAASIGEGGQNRVLSQTQQQQQSQNLQPNIDARSIFETKTAILGNNVKNLIILIPDEAHHGNGEAKENRFINQSFLPQEAVINRGTQVIWFSGDVNHLHKILLNGKSNSFNPNPYDSGGIVSSSASTPVVFNTIGKYDYTSPDVSPEAVKKGFVMRGGINVIDQSNKLAATSDINNQGNGSTFTTTSSSSPNIDKSKNTNNNNGIETVGLYMVPTKKADIYLSQLKEKGFSVDNTYSFRDVRGLARGTNSQQTLVVWTAGPNMSFDSVIAALKEITPTLPYK